jgi:hypothetical protein
MNKNVVIFSDGTGQRGGVLVNERRSNVYKLYRAKLTTRQFNSTSGFAAPEDINMAVCVLPGTELAFASPIRWKRPMWWGGWKPINLPHTTAIFRQINKDNAYVQGQIATVLQLPAQPVTTVEVKEQEPLYCIG